ncbi:enoyl-CoA hydratase/isomerase family protein [Mollisia scopiformis]|uniref:Enoyl-CoA hydratase/isomerase family protein n=1 Tax=Mollisia scopiformis TaxID=149040 RepID=A0A194XF90_MOLSC|nr:enoyl-CoA hydratase/isomerase family protein [Mollisia scopiformis]KUJ18432.1 enoyl-CoA hydratase/isomerase family protein [Mollisia scopiformis]
MASPTYKYFLVTQPSPYVCHVQINRPQKLNAFYEEMWLEYKTIFDTLSHSPDVRAIVLSGAGDRAFTAGLDVEAASQSGILAQSAEEKDVARKATSIKRHVEEFQACISSAEKCEKPVICVMHGFAFGLAIDISTCADIRICSSDVKFAVKEVDIGLAADIGTLSRLPKIVGNFSWIKDVAMSARVFGAEEAYRVGFVSQVLETKQKAVEAALKMAELLATKSPVAVQGTKELLNHARDHNLADSLRYTGVWNSAALQTSDVERAMLSGLKKTKPRFEKL